MKKFIPSLLIFGAFFSVFILSACKKKSSSESSYTAPADLTPVKNDWMVLLMEANPEILNPVISTDAYGGRTYGYIFDHLVWYNPKTGEPEPRLAESWTVSPDGLTYEFKIRENAKFHDGQPVTAEDVKFTFDTIKNPKVDAAHLQNYFKDLDSTEVVDTYHVRMKMKQVYFRNLIVIGLTEILPKHIYGKGDFNKLEANRHPVGSGPYKFSKWESGRLIELTRNPDYWGNNLPAWKDRYNFSRILFRIITEDQVAVMAMKKGEIDSMEPTASQFVTEFAAPDLEQKMYRLKYSTDDGNGYGFIGWNLSHPIFSSKKVRQAMAYAMPREEINKKIFGGIRSLAVGHFPPNSPKTDPNVKPIPYDLEKSKALLAEEGWKDANGDGVLEKDGKKFSFELLFTAGVPDNDRIALIWQQSLKNVGVDLRLRTLEWTVFLKQIEEKKFDSLMMGWGASLDGDPYQIWHSSQAVRGGSNRVGFKNAEVDKILEEARRTLDKEKRNALYQRFSAILADEAPYLFTFERPSLDLVTKRFQNVLPVERLGLDGTRWFTPLGQEKYSEAAQ